MNTLTRFVSRVADLMSGRRSKLHELADSYQGGLDKRIDENRELLELLDQRAPEFLERHPWVIGWLKAQDDFLLALHQAVPARHQRLKPRSWPRPALSGDRIALWVVQKSSSLK